MRKILLSMLALAVLLGGSSICLAQASPGLKTVATVSFSGYDELMADVKMIGELADMPELSSMLEMPLAMATGGKGLAGLDKSKPWGLIVQTDGGQDFPIVGFIPVTDLDALLSLISSMTGMPKPEAVNGVYTVPTPDGQSIFITEKNGYALISNNKDALDGAPADPKAALGGLDTQYDIAVKAQIKNIPEPLIQMATAMIKQGAEMGMPQMPGESAAKFEMRSGMTLQLVDQIGTMITDLDTITLGFKIDASAKSSHFDFEISAKPGSKLASQFDGLKQSTTDLAGFDLPDAAVTLSSAYGIADIEVAQSKQILETLRATVTKELNNQGLSPDDLKLASGYLNDAFDVLVKTIEGKKSDVAMAVVLKPGAATLVAGMTIVDGTKLNEVVKGLGAKAAEENPMVGQLLKLDAEKYGDVSFHVITIPTDEMDDQAKEMFGTTLEVVIGISDTKVYLAAGGEARSTLKSAIDGSKASPGKKIDPMKLSISAGRIAQFIAAAAPDGDPSKEMATQFADILAKTNGKDHLTMTATAIPNGEKVRIEFEEGILKLIGTAIQMGMQGMMGGGDMAPMIDDAPF